MIITRDNVYRILDENLHDNDENRPYLERITDLAHAAMIVHEYAFHCFAEYRERFIAWLIELLKLVAKFRNENDFLLNICFKSNAITGERIPGDDDFAMLCDLVCALTHKDRGHPIALADICEWLQRAWRRGVHQRCVHDMEFMGIVQNDIGILMRFGVDINMYGLENGLLPPVPTSTCNGTD